MFDRLDTLSMEDIEGNLPPDHAADILSGKVKPDEEDVPEGDKRTITVFVYGSLMKDFHNHRILRSAKLVGEAVTQKRYRMVSFGAYPAVCKAVKPKADKPSTLVAQRTFYRPVTGEVYKVDKATLVRLDALEGNGSFYNREVVPIDGKHKEAWMYILMHLDNDAPLVALDSDRNYSWKTEAMLQRLKETKRNQDGQKPTQQEVSAKKATP